MKKLVSRITVKSNGFLWIGPIVFGGTRGILARLNELSRESWPTEQKSGISRMVYI